MPVQKTVATDGHTYAPDTSFSFRVANGGEGTFEGNVVSAGVTGGLAEDENAVFTPSGTTPLASYTAHGSLAVDGSVFTSPGVYHYLVTEVSGDYEGMDLSLIHILGCSSGQLHGAVLAGKCRR